MIEVIRHCRKKKYRLRFLIPYILMAAALLSLAACTPNCFFANVNYRCSVI
jgi:hypothetical protein